MSPVLYKRLTEEEFIDGFRCPSTKEIDIGGFTLKGLRRLYKYVLDQEDWGIFDSTKKEWVYTMDTVDGLMWVQDFSECPIEEFISDRDLGPLMEGLSKAEIHEKLMDCDHGVIDVFNGRVIHFNH